MEIAFYFYTILVMLVCIAAGTISLSAYFVCRKRSHLYMVAFFLFYFLDLALIFQNEYLGQNTEFPLEVFYAIDQPALRIFFALGILEALWLIALDFLGEKRMSMRIAPAVGFVVLSTVVIVALPEGQYKQWLFYSMRQVFLLWCLGYVLMRYRTTKSEIEKTRLRRHEPLFLITLVLTMCIILEDTFMMLVWDPTSVSMLPLYISERNFSENFLMLAFAFFIAFCLETSLIFLDEYSYLKPDTLAEIVTFPFLHPWIKLAFSTLFIMSVWWVVLEYVERRTWLRIAVPCGACVLVQAAVVVAVQDSRLSQWIFYGVRDLCVASALGYGFWTYRRGADETLRQHLLRMRKPFIAFAVLIALVFAEDSLMMYYLAPQITDLSFTYHLSERNMCENVAVIFCAVLAIRSAADTLSIRFLEPPTGATTKVQQRAHTQLARYADRHALTPRERDVLALLLEGKDNQNIASALTLSLGTVKAHVHNIYRKANVSSRQQLLQSFWKED